MEVMYISTVTEDAGLVAEEKVAVFGQNGTASGRRR
jgi:hypothetical protein